MGYLVFARKYRPQVFEEVIGQHHVTRTLQNAIRAGRVAHALLFAGPRGVGKTSAARILAKALNCASGPAPVPCGVCESCREISSGVSIDVIEIDGASNRGINEIRELRENVKYAPARRRYKIFIIDEVHMLTPEAFNALLKTLEEPPGHIVFVFATTEPHRIPITILSRCQRFDFRRIPLKQIIERLQDIVEKEDVKISETSLVGIARAADGSMRDAESLLDQVISFAGNEVEQEHVAEVLGVVDRNLLYDMSNAITSGDADKCLGILDRLDQYGYDLRQFSRELLEHFRNLMVARIAHKPETLLDVPQNEVDELMAQSKGSDFRHIQQCFHVLLQADGDLSHSPFPKLIMEMALLKMIDIQPVLAADEILDRLEALEERLSQPGRELTRVSKLDSSPSGKPATAEEAQASTPEADAKMESLGDDASEASEEAAWDIQETWKRILDATRREKPSLGALLSHGQLVALSDRAIEIGFKRGSFHYDRVREQENERAIVEICRSVLNREVQVIFTMTGKASGRSRPAERMALTDQDRRAQKEILENPVVKEALEVFEGEIEDIRIANPLET